MTTEDKLFMVFQSLNRAKNNSNLSDMNEGIEFAKDTLKIWFDGECKAIGVGNDMSWFKKNETCYEKEN